MFINFKFEVSVRDENPVITLFDLNSGMVVEEIVIG